MNIQDDWKEWIGKVLGSESDIKRALQTLNREPKNIQELQDIIAQNRKKEIEQTAKDSAQDLCNDLPD